MAKSKSLLQEAIAEAKTLRETAIQNAYKQLEENITPTIKDILEQQLEKELDEEEVLNEKADPNSGFTEVKVKEPIKEEAEEEEEEKVEDSESEEVEEEVPEEDETDPTEEKEEEEDEEAAEKEEEKAEEMDDETKIKDLTIKDLKDLIADAVAQATGAAAEPAPEGNLGVDMEVADVEGEGDEEAPIAGDSEVDVHMDDKEEVVDDEENDEEIDLSELLKELEQEDAKVCPKCGKEPCQCEAKIKEEFLATDKRGKEHDKPVGPEGKCQDGELEDIKEQLKKRDEEIKNLKEGLNTINKTLNDVNLLNAKLVATNKMLGSKTLTESQKVQVIKAFDNARSPREVQVINKTLNESIEAELARSTKHRHVGSASRFAGKSTAPASVIDTDPVVRRFQELAGIVQD